MRRYLFPPPLGRSARSYLFGGAEISGTLANAGLAAARAAAGLMMAFGHGLGKLPPSEKFIGGVGSLGFPAPAVFAWAASLAEFAGGILLALGLLTRPSALLLAVTMLVAAFGRHAADPFDVKEKALLYLALSVAFLATGSGRFGVDPQLRR